MTKIILLTAAVLVMILTVSDCAYKEMNWPEINYPLFGLNLYGTHL